MSAATRHDRRRLRHRPRPPSVCSAARATPPSTAAAWCRRARRPGSSTGGSAPTTAGGSRRARPRCASSSSTACRWCRRRCGCPAATRCSACTARPPGDVGEVAVVEIANESPAPVRRRVGRAGRERRSISMGATVWADGRSAIRTHATTVAVGGELSTGRPRSTVTSGAGLGRSVRRTVRTVARGLVGAFLFPVAHRTSLRAVVTPGDPGHRCRRTAVRSRTRRPWPAGGSAQLDRGMQVELPDEALQRGGRHRARRDRARGSGVAGRARGGRGARGLGSRRRGGGRRGAASPDAPGARLRRRTPRTADVGRGAARAPRPRRAAPRRGARRAGARHATSVALLDDWPAEWIGQPIDVRDAPTRRGPGVVLGALARRPTGAALGGSRRARRSPPPGSTRRGRRREAAGRGAARAVPEPRRCRPVSAGEPEREELPRPQRRPTVERRRARRR